MSHPPHAFPPGVAEQLAEMAGSDAEGGSTPSGPPTVHFLGDTPISTSIDLEWPKEVGGVAYRKIVLRRLTSAEVQAFIKSIEGKPEDAKLTFPIFRRIEDDSAISDEVLGVLDDDDITRLNEAALGFLPRRFGGDPARALIPASGAITEP